MNDAVDFIVIFVCYNTPCSKEHGAKIEDEREDVNFSVDINQS